MSDSKKPPVKINLPQPEVTTLNAYRPNPVRDNADNELRSELYSRFLLPGETLEECEARMNKDLRESRKASLRLLSEKSGMVKPGVFRKRKVKERSQVAGSVTMKFLLDNGFTQEKPLNIVLSRIDQVVAQGRLHIIVSPTAKDGYRTVVTRSEPCLVDTFGVYFILMPVNVENDSVSCQQSNVLDDLVRSHTVPEDQAFDVIVIPMHLPLRAYKSLSGPNKDMDNWVQEMDALIEQDVLSRARHCSAWEEVRNKPNYPEELQDSVSLASDDFVEGMEIVGQPTNRDLLFGSQADKMYVPELVERIKESCKDKPVVVVTPRRPRFPSFFAGNVAMDSEADVVFSISNTVFSGDTHLAIHQPKKRPEGISGVQLKQTPKRVFVQLGNGAVYFAANHQHAEEVHRVIIDAVKPIRNSKS
jgi:putative NIF3 family GTP cyclohydrolase 1 type 2